jgi:SNF2-related domain/SNF2 Helicase protein/Helicase conserved C-terminal domain
MEGLIVLHGAPHPSGFALWTEGLFSPREGRDRHPRTLEPRELLAALSAEGLSSFVSARAETTTLTLAVPSVHGRPVPSAPALREPADYAAPFSAVLRTYEVPALVLPVTDALETLLALPVALRARPLSVSAGDDLDYWAEVARWVFDLLLRRRVAPGSDGAQPLWRPVLDDPHERERFRRLAEAMPPVSRALLPPGARPGPDGALPAARGLLLAFLDEAVDAAARDVLKDVLPVERRRAGDTPEAEVIAALASPPARALDAGVLARLTEWSLPLLDPLPESLLRLGIRVVPPSEPGGPFSLTYVLESGDGPEVSLPAEEIWATTEASVRRRGRLFTNPQDALLARLGTAAALSRPVARSLEERHPTGVTLSPDEAWRFLSDEAPLLGEAGIAVRLPGGGSLARVALRLVGRAPAVSEADAPVVRFGLDALVDFDWRVAVGDALLTPHEFEELAARQIPLVEIHGEWVLLDKENLEKARRLLDRRPGGRTTLGELLRLAGGLDSERGDVPVDAVGGEGWVGRLLDPEVARREIAGFTPPRGLTGTLRPYQMRGVGWLRFLLSRGLGACLADDMGLGKTIQFLAALLVAREAGERIGPSLLVCPTSVAENWVREAARFAPQLRVVVHHGAGRASGEAFQRLLADVDLLVTTYALSHRDRALLSDVTWEYLALDEAQNVKNPSAAQSRAARTLRAHRRAALTGTPVENRLAELKSIFDFLNPGLLGTDEAFRRNFALPIERHNDPAAAARLRHVTGPFLLRRAKTDPGVVPDLPEKIETKELVGLTREQAALYRATTRSLLSGIGRANRRSRKAKILLLLLRLKQICDHPALFLGDGRRNGRSAKIARLIEMCEETLAERSPALLFTQFAEMGHLLVAELKERFGCEVLFLHGAVPRHTRTEMVRRFQEDEDPPPFFVLSLRAGGTGLNLTRASHVFHVDRWWNPAVEEQATDRAFRIGQTQHVQVHKFVCKGTLEERIDRMIEEKKALARSIVGAGEQWIATLSDEQLTELVALDTSAIETDGGR